MKPSKTPLFVRILAAASITICVHGPAFAATATWIGASNGDWTLGTNWSTGTAPTAADIANFSFATSALNVKLNGNQAVLGLSTPSGGTTNVHTLIGDGTDRTLTIGASGISHLSGGLTIGSTAAGQKVDVILADTQTWNSSRAAGTGTAQAIFINNNVSLAGGLGTKTLELGGINTGSYVNGVISNAAGSTLNVVKSGAGTWTLNGANTYSGTTQINAGTLRLGAVGVVPSTISVASGATLSFRVNNGTAGLTSSEIDTYIAGTNFTAGALIGFDTSNGGGTYSGNYTSALKLVKTGANNLTLSGTSNATGGVTISEGGIILSSATSLTGAVSVAANASLIAKAGGANFTEAQIAALRASGSVTYAATGHFGISTANGDFAYNQVLGDIAGVRFMKADANTLFLTAQNTYVSATNIVGGILSVSDLKNGGLASQIGASTNAAANLIFNGGRLQYTGSGATTDRLFTLGSGAAIESSGTGALVFSSTGTMVAEGLSRTLNLTGYNTGDNTMGVNLANVVSGTTTSVVKNGSGKWILSGNNTHSGATVVRGGTLTLDYSGGKTPISSTGQVVVQNGTIEFLGSGAKTIGSLSVAETENGFGILKITGGMALTATTLTGSTNSQRHILIDTLGGGNSLSVNNISSTILKGSNDLIMTNANRANVVLRANDGTYGFAALSGTSVQKLSGQTAAAANSSNVTTNTVNYSYTAGSYTTSAALKYQTLTFDSSGGVINLAMSSGHGFNSDGTGRGVLFTGTNNVNISGAGGGIAQSTWFHNYLEGADLNISSSFGNSSYLLVGGTGFTNYTGTGLAAGANGQFVLDGGIFRYAPTANVTLETAVHRINNGIFEVGGNLNGGGALDLNRTTSNWIMTGDAGLSAANGNRSVSLGATVTWGTNNFLVNTANEDGDHTFRLSSSRSDSTIDFTTKIDLNGKVRRVEVADGSASVDARLSGGLTGASGIASGFVKTGAGTLEITGTNDYQGLTRVEGGRLLVGGAGLTATTSVHVKNATLGLNSSEVINNAANITLENGTIATLGNQTETMGRLILVGDNKLDLVGLANVIKMASSADQTWSSTLSIVNWNGNAAGGGSDQFFIGTDQNGVTSGQLAKISFLNPEVNGTTYTGTFGAAILNTGEIVAVIPEASSALLVAGASLGMAFRRRRNA